MACATTSRSSGSRCWSARALPPSSRAVARTALRSQSGSQTRANESERIGCGKFRALRVSSMTILKLSRLQAALAHDEPVGDSEQLGIGKLDPRPCVTVVVQHLDSACGERRVEPIGRFPHAGGFLLADGNQDHLERGDRLRPDDPALIVILLDGCGNDPCHTDAITAHVHDHLAAALIENQALHGLAVFAAQLEDMTHLDAPYHLESPAAGGTGIAVHDVSEVGCDSALDVPAPVSPGVVHLVLVGAANEVRERQSTVIRVQATAEPDGSKGAGLR